MTERKFRWDVVRIRRPKAMMKKLSALAIGAFIITLYLIFQTGRLQGKGTGVHRLNLAGIFQQPTRDPIAMKYQGKERMPPTIESMDSEPVSHTAEYILEYFLTSGMDGVEISWLSNTNTRRILQTALDDYLLMMVEVDVVARKDNGSSNTTALIAASSTEDQYELKLRSFLKYLATYSNKGVKLNIDSLDAMKCALQTVKTLEFDLHSPILLSFDVLKGPNGVKDPVDFTEAFALVKEYYPPITLSLGWTTEWSSHPVETSYSWYHVISMAKFCVKFQQRVSFSIRAVYAARSIRQIQWLISLSSRFSAIVWTDKNDILTLSELVYFRKGTDHRKIFYNLPKSALEELMKIESILKTDKRGKWDRTLWKPALLDDTSLAFLGEEHAVLEGDNSWLVSKVPHQPGLPNRQNVEIHGNVEFVKSPSNQANGIAKFSLFLRSSGVNPPPARDVHGVKLVIMSDGTVSLSSQNLIKAGMYKPQTLAKLPSSSCVSFRLIDSGEEQPILCTIKILDCRTQKVPADASNVSLHLRVPYDGSRQMFFIAVTGGTATEGIIIENLIIT